VPEHLGGDRNAVPGPFGVAKARVSAGEDGDELIPPTRFGRFSGLIEVGERALWGMSRRWDQNQSALGPGPSGTAV
jgi:hypothetical protein